MLCGKLLKILLPEYRTPFCTRFKFVDGKCRSCLNHVFMSWASEFDRNSSLFLLMKTSSENIYCEGSGMMI